MHRYLPLVFLACPVVAFSGNSYAQEQIDVDNENVLLRSARNAVALGNIDDAAMRYEDLLRQYPRSIAGLSEYAGILVQQRHLLQAVTQYETLIRVDASNTQARISLANIYMEMKELGFAAEQLEKALAIDSELFEAGIMLARIHAWNNDFEKATEVYQEYLQSLDASDPASRHLMVALLLDTRRPAEALPVLKNLLEDDPTDSSILADMARAYTMLGNHVEAIGIVRQLSDLDSIDSSTLLELSYFMRDSGNFRAAIELNERVLGDDENDADALISNANLHLAAHLPNKALQILTSADLDHDSRGYLQSKGLYHSMTGEYAHALEIYRELLSRNATDYETRLAIGKLYCQSGEYQKAKAELKKIPSNSSFSQSGELELARCLFVERRYQEAAAHCRSLMNQDPRDFEATVLLSRAYVKRDMATEARHLCKQFIDENPMISYGTLAVKTALAEAYLATGQGLRAKTLFEEILLDPYGGLIPEARYGLAKADSRLTGAESANSKLLEQGMAGMGADFRLLMNLGQLASADGDYALAIDLFNQILSWDPGNQAALVSRGEAKASLRDEAMTYSALTDFERLLRQAPSNIRARLGIARIKASMKLYEEAVQAYDLILQHDPTYSVAIREKARAQTWSQDPSAAAKTYKQLSEIEPFNIDGTGMPTAADVEGMHLTGAANAEIEAITSLEQRSKDMLLNRRYYKSIPRLGSLIETEPSNQEARFDLAQAFSNTGQTSRAISEYRKLLKINPNHREARMALSRNSHDLLPSFHTSFESINQDSTGYDQDPANPKLSGSSLSTTKFSVGTSLPLGDADERLRLTYTKLDLNPGFGEIPEVNQEGYSGNIFTVGYKNIPERNQEGANRFLVHSILNLEGYVHDLDKSITYDIGVDVTLDDQLTLLASAFSENVIENQNSLVTQREHQILLGHTDPDFDPLTDKDPLGPGGLDGAYFGQIAGATSPISRTGANVGLRYTASRFWESNIVLTNASYSDKNSLLRLHVANMLNITLPPKELKVSLVYDYQDFGDETPNDYHLNVGAARYFAPNNYASYSAAVSWRQWIGKDFFKGANQTWYDLSYTSIWDSNGGNYDNIRAQFSYDFDDHMSLLITTNMLNSAYYNSSSSFFGFDYRF
ncbi:MAG: tetratricopeptide repeat protein [Planctomycetes bacterium]|nr:tetratricopeptide repeat protein [Planctomycetota bacterium]